MTHRKHNRQAWCKERSGSGEGVRLVEGGGGTEDP
jgi:hypothetical protein